MGKQVKAVLEEYPEMFEPGRLHFDLDNPRFVDEKFADELEAIQYLYDNADVNELIQSMLSAGYIDFEPIVVLRKGLIVLEGNRRLAAIRLIGTEDIRRKLKIALPAIEDPKVLPEKVRVRWVDDRAEARGFIGFKHINGPFKWDALAKAKYAAAWFKEGAHIATISKTLGDNHNTVRRLVNGWYVLQQALNEGFNLRQISKRSFSFSHLYTALTRPSVRDFLGLTVEDLNFPPQENPVPSANVKDLLTLMSWLFGQEHKGEPAIIRSQNPDLNNLVRVLANSEAKSMLIAHRDLDVAYERVEPPANRFEEALMRAAKQAEQAMGLAPHYDGDNTLLRVAEGLNKTTRTLVLVMKDKAEG